MEVRIGGVGVFNEKRFCSLKKCRKLTNQGKIRNYFIF
jgi:hypothetical protein